jgi:hypothetical protein
MKNIAHSLALESRIHVHKLQSKMMLLDHCTRTQTQITTETCDPESLYEVSRKQNIRGSLTHITDKAYAYFRSLCEETLALETTATLREQGENMHDHIVLTTLSNEQLRQQWSDLFENVEHNLTLPTDVLGCRQEILEDINR